MKLRRVIGLSIVLALVTAACGGGDASSPTSTQPQATEAPTTAAAGPQVVDSADGKLSLKVEAGAPTVEITGIDAAAAEVEDAYLILGSYELGPDGTVFDSPVIATFDTGLAVDPDTPVPLFAVGLENDAGEYEMLSARVDLTGDTVVLTSEVPHFSRLVILGSPDAMWIWPPDVMTVVGDEWWGEWDLYDSRAVPLTNAPARMQYRRATALDEGGLVRIRTLIDGIDADAVAYAGGSVEVDGSDYVTSYAYLPEASSAAGPGADPLFTEHVEIFYGSAPFRCEVPGSGYYGFEVTVSIPAGSVAFATRLADGRRVVVVPSGGAKLIYEVDADAECIDSHYGNIVRIGNRLLHIKPRPLSRLLSGLREDGMHDGIWSISEVLPGVYVPRVDLWDAGMYRTSLSSRVLDPLINFSVFECGATTTLDGLTDAPVTTVCAAEPTPIPEGEVVIVAATFSDQLAIDGDGSEYVYSAVFDSNGDPADNWEFQGDFDWDFFRDTDRWYQVFIHADGTREMTVTDTLGPPLPSGARALLFGDSILWIIPMDEFSGQDPRGRVTAFVHDGTYNPETGMGDVIGADPTEPLMELIPLD